MSKSTLIDSNGENPNEAQAKDAILVQRERLNKLTPRTGDAIVRSCENKNRKRSAEMTGLNGICKPLITKGLG